MKNNDKIIAFYLPQYHEMEINNKWWGKGFTEWENVKKAKPLFEGHEQPKVPLNHNYYNLDDVDVMRWQAKIAKEHGLYGFCFYHYWFDSSPVMEKPLINYLDAKDIDYPFCFSWANESWTNNWAGGNVSVIMEQKYGGRPEWKKHFDFMLPYFKDRRYIKEDNCPLLVIYRPYLCNCMIEMLTYWKELAIENGFSGIRIFSQRYEDPNNNKDLYNYIDYHIEYQPDFKTKVTKIGNLKSKIHKFVLDKFNIDISLRNKLKISNGPYIESYDEMWKKIINKAPQNEKAVAGAFVNWDNTPRHEKRGTVFAGSTPEKFGFYMKKQIEHMHKEYKNDYMFIFAWNEWGEGGYLEPDEQYKYGFLEEMKKAIESDNLYNTVKE